MARVDDVEFLADDRTVSSDEDEDEDAVEFASEANPDRAGIDRRPRDDWTAGRAGATLIAHLTLRATVTDAAAMGSRLCHDAGSVRLSNSTSAPADATIPPKYGGFRLFDQDSFLALTPFAAQYRGEETSMAGVAVSAPGEVEFFVDDGTPVPARDEDSVDFGRDRMPRWAIVIMGLLVGAVVAALASQPQHKPVTAPLPEPEISTVSPTSTSGLGTPIPIDRASQAIDLAVTVPVFLLQPGHLYKVTGATSVGVSLDRPGLTLGTSTRLVVDAAANRVWVVELTGGGIIEFDARNLHRLRTIRTNESVRDAAALRGHLYLARATGLAEVAPGSDQPKIISGVGGYISSVAADPKRGRVLALVFGNGASVRQMTASGTVLAGQARVPVGGGTLRITTEGTIWLGGFGSAVEGAVLVRLDPKTLKPVLGSPVASRLGPSSWLEAAGDHDIWVRSAGNGDGLWCVDGRTGGVLQYWPRVRGAVTSRHGAAFALVDGLLVPLVLQDCTG